MDGRSCPAPGTGACHLARPQPRRRQQRGNPGARPPGDPIYRKPNSKEPSGLLRDNAMDLLDRLIPEPSNDEIVEAVKAALAEARQFGVTSVQDMDGSDAATRRRLFRLYQQMARNGQMTLRVDFR